MQSGGMPECFSFTDDNTGINYIWFWSANKPPGFGLVMERFLLFYRKEKKPTTSVGEVSLIGFLMF